MNTDPLTSGVRWLEDYLYWNLTPGVSTHFCWLGVTDYNLTPGKIYKISEWKDDCYFFSDDNGKRRGKCRQYDVEDASYEANLEKILE